MIDIVLDKGFTEKKCCGCTACAVACPKRCIEMKNDEEGFKYPHVHTDKCIKCGACERVCPILNQIKEIPVKQKAYLVQHRDDDVRLESTSGGAFTAVASYVLSRGGVVFGAAYDEHFQVRHSYAEKADELKKFRNSKYVQSDMGECFLQAKEFLRAGRWVCFSGTPCQIEGLRHYLKKDYENLILVDVVCRGVPSPFIWERYLEYQKTQVQKPNNIRFRDKFYGYKYSTMSFIKNGKNIYHCGSQLDPMLRAFFTDICDRPSCYACLFKKRYRMSDLTLWDCFSVYDFDKAMDDDKGTTRVLCHSAKGLSIMQEITDTAKCKEVEIEKLITGVKEMFESVSLNPKREQFFHDAISMDGTELFNKYYPITAKVKIKTLIRKVLLITGVYALTKKCLNKMRGR